MKQAINKYQVTEKGKRYLKYLQDKNAGATYHIQEFDDEIEDFRKSQDALYEKQLKEYKERHPNAKIVNALVVTPPLYSNIKAGDIVQIYNEPFYDGKFPHGIRKYRLVDKSLGTCIPKKFVKIMT